jgi:CheY-like chemotaxis protein
VLEDEGYEVVATGSATEALARVARDRPALVLLDYMLPILDGAEVAERLRAMDGLASVPIVLMSAVQPKPAGARRWDAFLQKPFRVSALLEVVTRFTAPG